MRGRVLLGLAALLMSGAAARAGVGDVGYVSGNQLYHWCSGDAGDQQTCIAYLAGLADAQTDRMAYGNAAFCVPAGVTLEQLREVVSDYLRAQAAYRQMSATVLATLALNRVYTCVPITPQK